MALKTIRGRLLGRLLILGMTIGSFAELAGQYGGPSLLSRGGNRPGRRGRAPANLNVYGSVRGIYESGLRFARVEETDEVRSVSAKGGLVEGGVYGGHDWRRVSLGVDYRADYRHLTSPGAGTSLNGLNGTNQVIAVDTTIRASRRTTVSLSQTGGTTNRAFGGFAAPAFGDLSRFGVPLNDVFDVRTYFTQAEAGFVHQRSARLSVDVAIAGFFVKRAGLSLINAQGYRATGGFNYRFTRRTTVGGFYQWMNFSYPRLLAASNVHAIAARLERRMTASWSAALMAGAYLIRSTGTQQVPLSPEVAEILGRPTGPVFFRRSMKAPLIDGQVSWVQERGRLTIGAASVMVPGNGIYLTSSRDYVSAGYSYAGTRRLSLGINGGYWRLRSQSLELSALRGWSAGAGVNYRLAASLGLMMQVDRRTFDSVVVPDRSGWALSVGLSYNPSRFPIAIW
jgi:hypothetical protein